MLDNDAIKAAAQHSARHLARGTKLAPPDERLRPHDRAEGYAIQALIEHHSAHPLVRLEDRRDQRSRTEAHQCRRADGRAHPAESVIADGGTTSLDGNEMRVAEPEFAFRMRVDLPPRATPYPVQEVLDAVDTLHPAIEFRIRASRISSAPAKPQIIADNACAHQFVLGPADLSTGARSISSRKGP